jgi:hypothetical protein
MKGTVTRELLAKELNRTMKKAFMNIIVSSCLLLYVRNTRGNTNRGN